MTTYPIKATIYAICLPVCISCIFSIGLWGIALAHFKIHSDSDIVDATGLLFTYVIFAILISSLVSAVLGLSVGLPLAAFFRWKGLTQAYQYALGGALPSLIFLGALLWWEFGTNDPPDRTIFWASLFVSVVSGPASGLLYWLLTRPDRIGRSAF
jgi:hypothetical protein